MIKYYKDTEDNIYVNPVLKNHKNLIEITENEAEIILNPQKTEEELTQIKVYDAKEYLSTTDFKMTVDYFSTLEEAKKQELLTKRAEAREYIRANEP